MKFGILGPVSAAVDGIDVPLGGAKQRTVLAALLLAGGRVLSNARLTTLLWDCDPPATAAAQIHTYVSRLRHRFGTGVRIVRQRPGYLIELDGVFVDHREFEALVKLGHKELEAGRFAQAARSFREALALWRGPALSNVTPYLTEASGPELDEARMAATESRIDAELCLGNHTQLVSELTGLVAEHPYRERLRVQLMTALYRCGRQADALAVHEAGRRLLAEEFGVDPGCALAQAHRGVLTGELAMEQAGPTGGIARTGGAWSNVRPCLLPPDVAGFTGRRVQLDEVCRRLRPQPGAGAARTVLLVTGMAGVGKTALTVRGAYACLDSFPDGQLYADLGGTAAAARSPFDVLGSFLRALGVDAAALPAALDERVHLYRSLLADRRMLVVLDDAVDESQVHQLLPAGPHCRAVVTSRRYLATLDGSGVMDLDVLDAESARQLIAGELGEARVRAEPVAVAEIVERCGGLPLALRIVAARAATRPQWPLARLAQRLAHHSCRLDELETEVLSVRASLRRSYESVDPDTRLAFHRLASVDAPCLTAWIAAGALNLPVVVAEALLERLADARLLSVSGVDHYGMVRYRFHVLVRCYGREGVVSRVPLSGRIRTSLRG